MITITQEMLERYGKTKWLAKSAHERINLRGQQTLLRILAYTFRKRRRALIANVAMNNQLYRRLTRLK